MVRRRMSLGLLKGVVEPFPVKGYTDFWKLPKKSANNIETQTLTKNIFKSLVKELLKEEASRMGPDSKAYKKAVVNMRDPLMIGIAKYTTEFAGEMEEDENKDMESDFTDDLDSKESDVTTNKGENVTDMENEEEFEGD